MADVDIEAVFVNAVEVEYVVDICVEKRHRAQYCGFRSRRLESELSTFSGEEYLGFSEVLQTRGIEDSFVDLVPYEI